MRVLNYHSLTTVVCLVAGASTLHAAFIQNSTGISNPAQIITFSEFVFPNNTAIVNQYSSLGVTFSPTLYYNGSGSGFYNFFPHISGNYLSNFNPGYVDPFSLNFTTVQSSVAFAFTTNPGSTTFNAYLGNTLVDSASVVTSSTINNNFYGFTGISFDRIEVFPGGSNSAMVMDNLQMGVVPEPSTYITGALLLLPFGAQVVRRLRAK